MSEKNGGRFTRFAPTQGRRIRGFESARAPPERGSAPSHCQKHPLKMKENLIKHCFKPISIKVMVVLTFIFWLVKLCKTAVIHNFALNLTATSGKASPRVSTILHPCSDVLHAPTLRQMFFGLSIKKKRETRELWKLLKELLWQALSEAAVPLGIFQS